jgi:hypothetical protein
VKRASTAPSRPPTSRRGCATTSPGTSRSRCRSGLNGRPDPSRGIDFFYLGYTDGSASRAQKIANKVASVFVEENSKVQTVRAQNTAEVLGQELAESQAKLTDVENRLRAKKQNYVGRLPDQIGANVQMVNGARQQFESLSIQIRAEQDRLAMLEGQLDSMRQGSGALGMTTSRRRGEPGRAEARRRSAGAARRRPRARLHRQAPRRHPPAGGDQAGEVGPRRVEGQQPSNRDELLKADPIYRAKVQSATWRSCTPRAAARRRDAQRRSASTRAASSPRRSSSRS